MTMAKTVFDKFWDNNYEKKATWNPRDDCKATALYFLDWCLRQTTNFGNVVGIHVDSYKISAELKRMKNGK